MPAKNTAIAQERMTSSEPSKLCLKEPGEIFEKAESIEPVGVCVENGSIYRRDFSRPLNTNMFRTRLSICHFRRKGE